MQDVLDRAALGARAGLGGGHLRHLVLLELRGDDLRVTVLLPVDAAGLDGLLQLGEGLIQLLALGGRAVLAQHALAEERHLGEARAGCECMRGMG